MINLVAVRSAIPGEIQLLSERYGEDKVRGGDGYLCQLSTELLDFAPADPLCERLAGVLADGAQAADLKSVESGSPLIFTAVDIWNQTNVAGACARACSFNVWGPVKTRR